MAHCWQYHLRCTSTWTQTRSPRRHIFEFAFSLSPLWLTFARRRLTSYNLTIAYMHPHVWPRQRIGNYGTSSSLFLCAFALARPSDNKPCLPCRRPSFWFRTFVFSLAILAYLGRPPLPRQHLQTCSRSLRTSLYRFRPTSPDVFTCVRVLACSESWLPFLRIYHPTRLLGHSDPAIYRTCKATSAWTYHLRYTVRNTSSYFVGNSTLQLET